MTTTLTDNATAAAEYAKFEKMIYQLCHKHQKRWGGDFDDILSDANLYFMRAVASHKSEKSRLITWVHNKVRWGLQRESLKKMERARKHRMTETPMERIADKRRKFDLDELTEGMSWEADLMVDLAVEDVDQKPRKARSNVVRLLLELGWCGKRIIEAMTEVRQAIGA